MRKYLLLLLIPLFLISCGTQSETVETVASPTSITTATLPPSTTTTATWIPFPELKPQFIPFPELPPTTIVQPTTTYKKASPPVTVRPSQPVRLPTHSNSYLDCVGKRESGGSYTAINRSSGAAGKYQMMPQTAKNTANHAGRKDLASKPVTSWSAADQEAMAQHLLQWQGKSPWAGGNYSC